MEEIIIKNGEFLLRETTEKSLGRQEKLLGSLVNKAPISFSNMYAHTFEEINLRDYIYKMEDMNLIITKDPSSEGTMLISSVIKSLPWIGVHEVEGDDYVINTLRGNRAATGSEEHVTATKWEVPSTMVFMIHAKYSHVHNSFMKGNLTVSRPNTSSQTYVPPYPNIFEDSSDICMGEDFVSSYAGSGGVTSFIGHFVNDFIPAFIDTPMNNDLTMDRTYKFFRFLRDDDTGEFTSNKEALPENWWAEVRLPKVQDPMILSAVAEAVDGSNS